MRGLLGTGPGNGGASEPSLGSRPWPPCSSTGNAGEEPGISGVGGQLPRHVLPCQEEGGSCDRTRVGKTHHELFGDSTTEPLIQSEGRLLPPLVTRLPVRGTLFVLVTLSTQIRNSDGVSVFLRFPDDAHSLRKPTI